MSTNPAARIALGTANLGLQPDRDAGYAMLDAFVDLGGEIIDTAAIYSDWVSGEIGRSESVIGEWLARRGGRDKLTLVTKGAHPPMSDVSRSRLDRGSIDGDIALSLRRLRTDHIDLYFLHRDDSARPVADIMGTLLEAIGRGDIGAIGVSNWHPARIAEARRIAGLHLASTQILGNVLCRHMNPPKDTTLAVLDPESFAQAKAENLTLMLYTAQAQGALGKPGSAIPADYDNAACREAIAQLRDVARGAGIEVNALGVAFLLQLYPRLVPIAGARTPQQLRESLAAASLALDEETMAAVAEISGFLP